MPSVAGKIQAELRGAVDPAKAKFLPQFFKAGPDGYAEGDRFIGVVVPRQRIIARRHWQAATPEDLKTLLLSPIHEDRLTALLILIFQMKGADAAAQDAIAAFYLQHKNRVNNWDLVDLSARDILGPYFERHDPAPLIALTDSASVWDRRIAMVTTYYFIRRHRFDLALDIAARLANDPHDLIQKAVGWMLREIGNRDLVAEETFLKSRYKTMPRTMLRYAIEKFDPGRRADYLSGQAT